MAADPKVILTDEEKIRIEDIYERQGYKLFDCEYDLHDFAARVLAMRASGVQPSDGTGAKGVTDAG